MKHLLFIALFLVASVAQAGQCYKAYKESKKLEKIVDQVNFMSESDSGWEAFASWVPLKEVTEEELKRVLKLKEIEDGEKTYFKMSDDHSEMYSFLNEQIEMKNEYALEENDSSYKLEVKQLNRLKKRLARKFGKNVRLVLHGPGDGDSFFVGNHMIVIIMDNGCVLGLRALTVWT